MQKLAVGIDIGGTNTDYGFITEAGVCLLHSSFYTPNYPIFENFVRDIQNASKMDMLPNFENTGEEPVFKKLGKSIAAYSPIKNGDVLTLENLRGRIFESPGVPVRESNKLIGKKVVRDICEGEKITWEDIIEA